MSDANTFSYTFEARRLALGLSINETSEFLGVPPTTVHRWRNGAVTRPRGYEKADSLLQECEDWIEGTVSAGVGNPSLVTPDLAQIANTTGIHPPLIQVAYARILASLRHHQI